MARASRRAKRFYREALTQAERADFPVALEVEGVDQEIALLRLRLRTALEQRPGDFPLMLSGVGMLVRALAVKYRLSKREAGEVTDRIREVLSDHRTQQEYCESGNGEHED